MPPLTSHPQQQQILPTYRESNSRPTPLSEITWTLTHFPPSRPSGWSLQVQLGQASPIWSTAWGFCCKIESVWQPQLVLLHSILGVRHSMASSSCPLKVISRIWKENVFTICSSSWPIWATSSSMRYPWWAGRCLAKWTGISGKYFHTRLIMFLEDARFCCLGTLASYHLSWTSPYTQQILDQPSLTLEAQYTSCLTKLLCWTRSFASLDRTQSSAPSCDT